MVETSAVSESKIPEFRKPPITRRPLWERLNYSFVNICTAGLFLAGAMPAFADHPHSRPVPRDGRSECRSGLPDDYNGDGRVNGRDYQAYKRDVERYLRSYHPLIYPDPEGVRLDSYGNRNGRVELKADPQAYRSRISKNKQTGEERICSA